MVELRCRRCDSAAEGLGAAPLPGAVGQLVLAGTCCACWDLWREEQVKLINENKLSPAKAEDYEFLVDRMKGFLKLE
jgi:Fe-S cluster biosynthesis and repair protein YggX